MTDAHLRQIIAQVASKHGVRPSEVTARQRSSKKASAALQEVMWRFRALGIGNEAQGAFLGRDPSTISHGVQRHLARTGGNQ